MARNHEGCCACGAVRYRLESELYELRLVPLPHLLAQFRRPRDGVRQVPAGDLVWTKGADKVRSFKSSRFGSRSFCGECGTPFLMRVDHQPETIDFSVSTLDDSNAVAPGFQIFRSSRIGWFDPGDGLPRHDRFRPEMRGLEGSEPPA